MTIKPEDIYTIAPHHRFQWEKAQDCYVILFPEGMVKLNGGAGEVLNLVNDKALQKELTQKGKKRLKAFETARSRAVKYIDLCETLVNLKED